MSALKRRRYWDLQAVTAASLVLLAVSGPLPPDRLNLVLYLIAMFVSGGVFTWATFAGRPPRVPPRTELEQQVADGLISVNEARRRAGLNPFGDPP